MVQISLYENAFDSIMHGIEHLEVAIINDSKQDYKHSLLATFQGVELLLKQLLYLKNPIYVFCKNSLYKKCNDPLNPTLDELFNCKSLDISELCNEVIKYYEGFDNLKIVRDLAKERNKLQHFAIKLDEKKLIENIIKLNHKVITPAFRIIGEEIDISDIDQSEISMKIEKVFSAFEVADKEERFLNLTSNVLFKRAGCPDCGNYSLFVLYKDGGYPTNYYCTSCHNFREDIKIDEFFICPDCGWPSLIYSEELNGGICLCEDCDNSKEAVLIDMIYCDTCNTYKIEDICECNADDKE